MKIRLCPRMWRTFVSQRVRISRNSMADQLLWRTLRLSLHWQTKTLRRHATVCVTISTSERTLLTTRKTNWFRCASWQTTSLFPDSGPFSPLSRRSLIPLIVAAGRVRVWIFGTTLHEQKRSSTISRNLFKSISKLSKTGSVCFSNRQFPKLESLFLIFSFFQGGIFCTFFIFKY